MPTTPTVPFATALRFWFKLGCISFGGPAGQIALMHREIVEEKRWLTEAQFLHALNYCMVLPGPEAQQLATYLGWLMHRTWGGIVAGALFVLPSLALLIGLSWLYAAYGQTPLMAGLFYGIKPAVAALVFQAAWRLGQRTLRHPGLLALAVGAFAALLLTWPFPLILLLAATVGLVGHRRQWPAFLHSTQAALSPEAPQTPPPAHTQFTWPRLLKVVAVGLALWALPMAGLAALGLSGLVQMGDFFTRAALLTFGGAYAVLPYVFEGAVSQYQWLSTAQMMDGLALGESTPGPLIMVVAFVGFMGGWHHALLGPDHLALAGTLAACVVTWFTFLPSFLFILAGGPLVESSRRLPQLAAPLTAITAAIVGVIAHLAVFLGLHTVWPRGLASGPDAAALIIALAAGVALIRLRWGVIPVLLAAALAGLGAHGGLGV